MHAAASAAYTPICTPAPIICPICLRHIAVHEYHQIWAATVCIVYDGITVGSGGGGITNAAGKVRQMIIATMDAFLSMYNIRLTPFWNSAGASDRGLRQQRLK